MADDETPLVNLSIHLIKDDRGDVDAILKRPDRLTKHDLNLGKGTACELYIKRPRSHPPKWADLFSEHVELRTFGRIASSAAVLVLTVNDRWFAITFGQGGRFLLDLDSVEERFGLLVVLNSIPENRVRSIDKTAFDPLATHSRIQTSREATPRDFGLDVETDLVKAVTGTPSDSALGHRLHGMDMLSATIRATVDEIPELLSLYYRQSRSKSYKKSFPWLDHIAEVKDIALRHRLDQLLLDRIHKEEYERCWLAVPELVDWDKIDGFKYGAQKRNARHHDIDIRDFVAELDEIAADGFEVSDIDLKLLLNRKVRCIGEDSILIHQWPVYKCLNTELDYKGDSYLLSNSKWFKVAGDFVDEVNEYFAQIPRYQRELPMYDDDSEGHYNERVSVEHSDTFALMDNKNIMYGGGPNRIEFCDLYSNDADIIHVKRYGGSSVLSHLFAQGTTSGELFKMQSDFRELVHDRLPDSHKFDDFTRSPNADEYQVVFAIVSKQSGTNLSIPFFARLNLRSATRRLRAYGYRVAVKKIGVKQERVVLKTFDG